MAKLKFKNPKTGLWEEASGSLQNLKDGTGAGSLYMNNTSELSEPNDGGELHPTPDTTSTAPIAAGAGAFAVGIGTEANGDVSVAEGILTRAGHLRDNGTRSIGSHAEGVGTFAKSSASHAEGYHNQSLASNSHTEGFFNKVESDAWSGHAEGRENTVTGVAGHAEGHRNTVSGANAHAEGDFNTAEGENSHAENEGNLASGKDSHAEGKLTAASGAGSHTEGYSTEATNDFAHAEGNTSAATGKYSHAEGRSTTASGESAHSEGRDAEASGYVSHAEGAETHATASATHTEGVDNTASAEGAHAEGKLNTASGRYSHVGGYGNTAANFAGTVIGQYAKVSEKSSTKYDATGEAFVIGNGTDKNNRSNAFEVHFDGTAKLGGKNVATENYVDNGLKVKAGLTSANTFTGTNTFSGTVQVPTPTADTDAATKKYVDDQTNNKVDKITGKGLSTNDFTNADKEKVEAIPANPKYTDTTYTAGTGISISDTNVISATGGGSATIGNVTASATSIDSSKPATAIATISGNDISFAFGIPKGPKGAKGDKGSDANVTTANITAALGYTPANASIVAQNTSARHTHSNKTVLDGITAEKVSQWDNSTSATSAPLIVTVSSRGSDLSADKTYAEIVQAIENGKNVLVCMAKSYFPVITYNADMIVFGVIEVTVTSHNVYPCAVAIYSDNSVDTISNDVYYAFDYYNPCLIEGTPIDMADGTTKAIEDVQTGDLVQSYNPATGEITPAVVLLAYITGHEHKFTSYSFSNGKHLTIYGMHGIYNKRTGITKDIRNINKNDQIVSISGDTVQWITSSEFMVVGEKKARYNIVTSNNLYYANGILLGQKPFSKMQLVNDFNIPLSDEIRKVWQQDVDDYNSYSSFLNDPNYHAEVAEAYNKLTKAEHHIKVNKQRLLDSDYWVQKFTEGLLSFTEWAEAKAKRAAWRKEVNDNEVLRDESKAAVDAIINKYRNGKTPKSIFESCCARDNEIYETCKNYFDN